ncbi:MAG: class I adenylate-forming enzyme family protein, partial [Sedimentisphaerales bacterium]|nr:class I adenylate-forming enzyme family protein [Sedimentisphaerales bacterium]
MGSVPFLVHQFLTAATERQPDRPAIWDQASWYTYAQLERWSNQIARWLCNVGIQRGDRVAMLMLNSKDYAACYMGILKAGAVAVPLNTASTAETLASCLKHAEAKVLLTQKRFSKVVNRALQQDLGLSMIGLLEDDAIAQIAVRGGMHIQGLGQIYRDVNDGPVDRQCIDLDLAMIVYTSGSTGQPKGVMLSHLNLISNTRSIVHYLGLTSDDRVLVVLPFFYIYGNSLLLTHLMVGGSVVIENRFAFPQVVLETMKDTSVTGLAGVPSTFVILLDQSDLADRRFESLRYVTQAGGHMPVSVQRRLAAAIAPAKLYIMYGTTEAAPRLTFLEPQDLDRKAGSVGKAVLNVEIAVVDDQDRPVEPGQTGQVIARGSNIMVGYWRDPEETAKALRNGWYHTGDMGWMDDEGYLYLVGRSQDIVKVGGQRVSILE